MLLAVKRRSGMRPAAALLFDEQPELGAAKFRLASIRELKPCRYSEQPSTSPQIAGSRSTRTPSPLYRSTILRPKPRMLVADIPNAKCGVQHPSLPFCSRDLIRSDDRIDLSRFRGFDSSWN